MPRYDNATNGIITAAALNINLVFLGVFFIVRTVALTCLSVASFLEITFFICGAHAVSM